MRGIQKILVAGLVGLCFVSSVRADDTYKIKLDRAFKPGDSFGVSTKLNMKFSQKVSIGGVAHPDQDKGDEYSCQLDGTETVVGVSDNSGQPTKYTFKVTTCTKDGKVLIPEGSTVTAENVDGKTTVLVDGKAPAEDVAPVLMDIFETNDPKDPSSDTEMGTTEPQKVGGSWEFKTDTLAKKLQDEKLPFAADDMKGKGSLNEITKVDGKDVEKITVGIEGAFDKKDGPAAGTTFNNGKLKVEVVGMIPADEDARPLSTVSTVSMSFTITTPEATVDIKVDRSKDSTYTAAK
jgi:hypothetical protein